MQSLDGVIEALVERAPLVIDALARNIEPFIKRLAELAPQVIKALVTASPRITAALAESMPEVALRLAIELQKAAPLIAVEFSKALVAEAPTIASAIARAIAKQGTSGVTGGGAGLGVLGFAKGGIIGAQNGALLQGGIPGIDSIPFFGQRGELVVPDQNFDEVINAVAAQREAQAPAVSSDTGGGGNQINVNFGGDVFGAEEFADQVGDVLADKVENDNFFLG